jgi:hypothetical protein
MRPWNDRPSRQKAVFSQRNRRTASLLEPRHCSCPTAECLGVRSNMWNWFNCRVSGRHEYGVWCEPGAIFLRCVHCSRRSSGWAVDAASRRQATERAVAAPPSAAESGWGVDATSRRQAGERSVAAPPSAPEQPLPLRGPIGAGCGVVVLQKRDRTRRRTPEARTSPKLATGARILAFAPRHQDPADQPELRQAG